MENLRKKIVDLAAVIAQREAERSGCDYKECIPWALDEACKVFGIKQDDISTS